VSCSNNVKCFFKKKNNPLFKTTNRPTSKFELIIKTIVFLIIILNISCNFSENQIKDNGENEFNVTNYFSDGENFKVNEINDLFFTDKKLFIATQGGGIVVKDGNIWMDLNYDIALNAGETGNYTFGDISSSSNEYLLPNKIVSMNEFIFLGFNPGLGNAGLVMYDGSKWQTVDYFNSRNDVSDFTINRSTIYISNYEYGVTFELPEPTDPYYLPGVCEKICSQISTVSSGGIVKSSYVNIANSPIEGAIEGTISENSVDFPENIELIITDSLGDIIAVSQRWYDPKDIINEGINIEGGGDIVKFNCEIGPGCSKELVILRLKKDNPSESINSSGKFIELVTEERFNKIPTGIIYNRISGSLEHIWLGTTEGLFQIRLIAGLNLQSDEVFYTTTSTLGSMRLPDNHITSLAKSDKHIWIGTKKGLAVYSEGRIRILDTDQLGLPDYQITSLASDGNSVWVGTRFGLSHIKLE